MKKLIQELHKGKNVKENLKRYAETAVQTYVDYGTLELTFSAYTIMEEMLEGGQAYAPEEKEMASQIRTALGTLSREDCPYGALAEEMKGLREEITKKMDLFTAYTDRMICYEYVLNRMELCYLPEKELTKRLAAFPEDVYMNHLNNYLYGNKDQQLIHDKLQLVIGQVPVHMTKSKLFEKISEAMTLYKGNDRSSLDQFLYMIRTAAMIYEPQHYVGQYPELEQILDRLEKADYEDMGEDLYEELVELLEKGSEQLHNLTDFYYNFQKVVNGIYALCVILPHAKKRSSIYKAGRTVWESLSLKECEEELLVPLEGQIEQSAMNTSYLESILFELRSSYGQELSGESLTSLFEDFVLVANLLSDSLFIDLVRPEEEEPVDAAYVQSCSDQLFDELAEKMSQITRPVKRAMMGQIIEKLPLIFQNTEEVQQYIRVNLFGCQNKAEKCVVLEMLWDVMQEEQEWSVQ